LCVNTIDHSSFPKPSPSKYPPLLLLLLTSLGRLFELPARQCIDFQNTLAARSGPHRDKPGGGWDPFHVVWGVGQELLCMRDELRAVGKV